MINIWLVFVNEEPVDEVKVEFVKEEENEEDNRNRRKDARRRS